MIAIYSPLLPIKIIAPFAAISTSITVRHRIPHNARVVPLRIRRHHAIHKIAVHFRFPHRNPDSLGIILTVHNDNSLVVRIKTSIRDHTILRQQRL